MGQVLLSFGHGYSARALAERLVPKGWTIYGTTRKESNFKDLEESGVTPILWPGGDLSKAIERATHILISPAPGPEGDPVFAEFARNIEQLCIAKIPSADRWPWPRITLHC